MYGKMLIIQLIYNFKKKNWKKIQYSVSGYLNQMKQSGNEN